MRIKTFLITLFTFLLFLYGGVAFFLTVSLKSNLNNIKERAMGEHYFILSSYYSDLTSIQERKKEEIVNTVESLFDSYSIYYQKQPVELAVYDQDGLLKSTMPDKKYLFDTEIGAEERKVFFHSDSDTKKEFLFVTGRMPEPFDSFMIVYCYDLTEEVNQWTHTAQKFFGAVFLLAVPLGMILYIVLYYIFKPLTQIANAAEKIADGNYDNKINVDGKGEIGRVADSFNHMVNEIQLSMEKLSETAKQKQEFIDNFAHELRTPLTSIYGYAEYIQKAKLSDWDLYESTCFIMSESQRLQKLADQLLQLALYREQNLEWKEINLSDLILSLESFFKMKLNQKGISFKTELEKCMVKGDEILLECLFSNILENAIKACHFNGRILIRAFEQEKGKAVVTIEDNGKGIPKDAIQHLTESFYRVDQSRSKAEGGAGIGLALCKQIAERHSAYLDFFSENHKTIVTVTFTGC